MEGEPEFETPEAISEPPATLSASKSTAFGSLAPVQPSEWRQLVQTLVRLNAHTPSQASINDAEPRNVWIIKPAGKSRGRGISCSSDVGKILKNRGGNSKEAHWVVQKYIERPLLIMKRKFDIRQWVLVTGWNPLTVYFFTDCYLRFCCVDFTLDNLKNKYVHLANNSIQKKSKLFINSPIKGNMWHSDQFIEYIEQQFGSADMWYKMVQPQMERIVVWSLQSAQDMVMNRQNSCELYGYDFMIDASWRPWLIEINSSPDFSYSTKVTERLVKECAPDIVKVLVDVPEHEKEKRRRRRKKVKKAKSAKGVAKAASSSSPSGVGAGATAGAGAKAESSATEGAPAEPDFPDVCDTGKWKLAYRAPFQVSRPLSCLAQEFVVRGTPVVPQPTSTWSAMSTVTLG